MGNTTPGESLMGGMGRCEVLAAVGETIVGLVEAGREGAAGGAAGAAFLVGLSKNPLRILVFG